MLNDINDIIDYFLKVHHEDHRSAMAWLIGRMESAEREVIRYKREHEKLFYTSIFNNRQLKTTVEAISEEIEDATNRCAERTS